MKNSEIGDDGMHVIFLSFYPAGTLGTKPDLEKTRFHDNDNNHHKFLRDFQEKEPWTYWI